MLEVLDGRAQMTPVHIPRPRHMGSTAAAQAEVEAIVEDVRTRGDAAILSYGERGAAAPVPGRALRVPEAVVSRAPSMVRPEFMDALEVMIERLRRTCERQLEQGWLDRGPDEVVGEIVRPLRRIGVHVPGGRAVYPSSVVMCVTPAQVAGVEGIAVASPPDDTGEVAEPVLAACALLGVSEVYRMSGAAAIAGLAHGTASVRPVEKIVGRGDIQVTLAKRLVRGWVDTDADPGVAELAIIADGRAAPRILAADLVAQAEHGPNGAHVLITWDSALAE
ncbi:MAG: histidinol dehydrogenase, partial [Chloroflexota bacterium]|nr:histidinol dehydrogenase [Chloroflexota bacterium]